MQVFCQKLRIIKAQTFKAMMMIRKMSKAKINLLSIILNTKNRDKIKKKKGNNNLSNLREVKLTTATYKSFNKE